LPLASFALLADAITEPAWTSSRLMVVADRLASQPRLQAAHPPVMAVAGVPV
jgi:hypothetical protein